MPDRGEITPSDVIDNGLIVQLRTTEERFCALSRQLTSRLGESHVVVRQCAQVADALHELRMQVEEALVEGLSKRHREYGDALVAFKEASSAFHKASAESKYLPSPDGIHQAKLAFQRQKRAFAALKTAEQQLAELAPRIKRSKRPPADES